MTGTPFILDTDCSNDPGDIGAIAVACAYHRLGHGNLLGIVVNTSNSYTPGCVDAICKYLGVSGLPIGALKRTLDPASSAFPQTVYNQFPHDVGLASACPSAVSTYRTLLAGRSSRDVTITSVGLLSNLYDLLQSPADGISALTGSQLVAAKCKQLVIMGAGFTGSPPAGHEWNIYNDPADASYVVANWPSTVPIVFSGHEVGLSISNSTPTGLPASNPINVAYASSGYTSGSRPAWDETAVMFTCEGATADWQLVWGTNVIDSSTGNNTFTPGAGNHAYLVKKRPDAYYGARISDLTASPLPAAWSSASLVRFG